MGSVRSPMLRDATTLLLTEESWYVCVCVCCFSLFVVRWLW